MFVQILRSADPGRLAAHDAASGERGAREPITRSVGMKEPSAVIIPQHRQASRKAHQRGKVLGHAFQLVCVAGAGAGDRVVEQEHVQRIHVIVSRLLEVASVAAHLPLELFLYQRGRGAFPSPRAGPFREQRSDRMQRHRLTQQMSIG